MSIKYPSLAIIVYLLLTGCSSPSSNSPSTDVMTVNDIVHISEIRDAPTNPTNENHPPVLTKIGDRIISLGERLHIVLSASDIDNDPLTFSVYGDIPDGASFDKINNTFTWVPLQTGLTIYLTFVVSDGKDIDRETIQLKVVAEKIGHPPTFEPISDQQGDVGVPFVLQLEATDPDGDPLTFSILGDKPQGATLSPSTGEFSWTPSAFHENSVVPIAFSVSDGVFDDTIQVQFLIGPVGSLPMFAPIPIQEASVGNTLRFSVSVQDPSGEPVSVTVHSGMPTNAFFDSHSIIFSWVPLDFDAGRAYTVIFAATNGRFHSYTKVDIHVARHLEEKPCQNDMFEPNNSPEEASFLQPGTYPLSICDTDLSPVDEDWFLVFLQQGERLSVVLQFEHNQGDIDCDLSLDGSEEAIVAYSNSTTNTEFMEYIAEETGEYVLAIYGVGDVAYSTPYTLTLSIDIPSGHCQDDVFAGNSTIHNAAPISEDDPELSSLRICPDTPDYFALQLNKGEDLLAGITVVQGKAGLQIIGPDKTTILDSAPPSSTSAIVLAMDTAAGTHYLHVFSSGEASYSLELFIEAP